MCYSLQRVMNKTLHCTYLTVFWIYHGFKFIKKMMLEGFWRFLRFWIYQDSKYAEVTQGLENAASQMLDRIPNIPQALNVAGFSICPGYTRLWIKVVLKRQGCRELRVLRKLYSRDHGVNWILETDGILNIPQALNIPRFWIYQES